MLGGINREQLHTHAIMASLTADRPRRQAGVQPRCVMKRPQGLSPATHTQVGKLAVGLSAFTTHACMHARMGVGSPLGSAAASAVVRSVTSPSMYAASGLHAARPVSSAKTAARRHAASPPCASDASARSCGSTCSAAQRARRIYSASQLTGQSCTQDMFDR